MPAEATSMIDVVQELGTSASALIFFAWLIIFILKQHDKEKQQLRSDAEKKDSMMMEERKLYLAADAKNDEELRQYMKTSNSLSDRISTGLFSPDNCVIAICWATSGSKYFLPLLTDLIALINSSAALLFVKYPNAPALKDLFG